MATPLLLSEHHRAPICGRVAVFFRYRCILLVAGALILTVLAPRPSEAQVLSSLSVGALVQKNAVVLPGIEVSYADESLLGGRSRLSLAYLTSRPSTAMGSRGLVEDRVLLGAALLFRRGTRFEPFLQLQAGYTRFDREEADLFALLDNNAVVASLMAGAEVDLFDSRFALVGDIGYSILHSSTVYPFVTSLGIRYSFRPRNVP